MQLESSEKAEMCISKKKFPNSNKYWKFTRFINLEVIFDLVKGSIYWTLTTGKREAIYMHYPIFLIQKFYEIDYY